MARHCRLREARRIVVAASRATLRARTLCSNSKKSATESSSAAVTAPAPTAQQQPHHPQTITGVLLAKQRTLAAARANIGGSLAAKAQWKPSQAFQGSATTIHRAVNAAPKLVTSEAAESTTPGLRRRGLLGSSAGESQSQGLRASAMAPVATTCPTTTTSSTNDTVAVAGTVSKSTDLCGSSEALKAAAAVEGEESSVVASSATKRFRERRRLERLAATGDAQAIEALDKTTVSATNAERAGGRSSGTRGSGGIGDGASLLFPIVLVVMAGVGYCFLNDLLPSKALTSALRVAGGDSGDTSVNAESEGDASRRISLLNTAASTSTLSSPSSFSQGYHEVVSARERWAIGDNDDTVAGATGRKEPTKEQTAADGIASDSTPGYIQWLARLLGRYEGPTGGNGGGASGGSDRSEEGGGGARGSGGQQQPLWLRNPKAPSHSRTGS